MNRFPSKILEGIPSNMLGRVYEGTFREILWRISWSNSWSSFWRNLRRNYWMNLLRYSSSYTWRNPWENPCRNSWMSSWENLLSTLNAHGVAEGRNSWEKPWRKFLFLRIHEVVPKDTWVVPEGFFSKLLGEVPVSFLRRIPEGIIRSIPK